MIGWRINLILIFFLLLGSVLIGRLFYIQIIRGDYYMALAQGQGLPSREKETLKERGEIFFKNGEPLAVNADWFLVFSSPLEVKEKEETAEKLAEILSSGDQKDKSASSPFADGKTAKRFIMEKLEKETLYEPIKKKISSEEIQKIKEANLKGIYLDKEAGRYYPQGSFASQLVGFLGADLRGQYGIEGHYEEILRGTRKERGKDIFLTLDYSVQFKAEKLLEKAGEDLNIEGGEIIVINPNSGEILALANFPNFDPNQYSKVSDFKIFKNGATQKIFEPGSIFKPITMAGALEKEKITPQTVYIDKGFVSIGGYTVRNYDRRVWGEQSMTEVLEKSINTGAVFAEEKLGHNYFLHYLEKFGFFKRTGVDFPEIYSENREFKKGYEINFATASFGQGIEMTPLQLVRSFAVIANGGKMVRPYLVEKTAGSREALQSESKTEEDQVISSKTAAQLTAMLVSVTEKGFAKSARVPGYYVAGKTGTAQISFAALGQEKRGYSDKTWQSFVGFLPAFNPEFLILVKLNNPAARTAEYSATPIFQDLARHLVDYYQIPPDYQSP